MPSQQARVRGRALATRGGLETRRLMAATMGPDVDSLADPITTPRPKEFFLYFGGMGAESLVRGITQP